MARPLSGFLVCCLPLGLWPLYFVWSLLVLLPLFGILLKEVWVSSKQLPASMSVLKEVDAGWLLLVVCSMRG